METTRAFLNSYPDLIWLNCAKSGKDIEVIKIQSTGYANEREKK